jgi:hypothetical protein
MDSPVREYKIITDKSGNPRYVNRVLVATPTTGLVRMEWVAARYGQIIPTNWSQVQMNQFMHGYIPIEYSVADAQNLIVKAAVEGDFEWLLLVEHDTMPPPDAFVQFNNYMQAEDTPVVSGLYFTKSQPSEPLIYRGRGTSYYGDWKIGDKVWCDGVPTGMLLIHCAILREMWKDSEPYTAANQETRMVFETPRNVWWDPEEGEYYSLAGTSDLNWCTRVMKDGYFAKAGWKKYQEMKYPFLVDTNIFCRHIDMDGIQYPTQEEINRWKKEEEAPPLGISVSEKVAAKERLGG